MTLIRLLRRQMHAFQIWILGASMHFSLVMSQVGGKYDLEVKDLNEFCPLVPGFEQFNTLSDSRANDKLVCYKYFWVPDPCTMEVSGREESDMLHCGHYNMRPCNDMDESRSGNHPIDIPFGGFDLQWEEVTSLCDKNVIKNPTQNKIKGLKMVYWKWNFCVKTRGTDEKPCGRYTMTSYTGEPLPV